MIYRLTPKHELDFYCPVCEMKILTKDDSDWLMTIHEFIPVREIDAAVLYLRGWRFLTHSELVESGE